MFGSNFVERETPVRSQHFCINQAMALGLLK